MEIQTIDRIRAPKAKTKQKQLLFVAWVVALIVFVLSGLQNWGGFAAAGLFTAFVLFARETPYRINLESGGLTIRRGASFLWGARIEELVSVEVKPEAKRLGVVFSPKRVVFRKRSGDLFAIDFDLFEEIPLQALMREAQQHLLLKR
jgi:hypothetical protein